MDWTTIVNMLAGVVMLKGVEEIGSCTGKSIYEMISTKAKMLINLIRTRFSNEKNSQAVKKLDGFLGDSTNMQQDLVEVLSSAANQTTFIKEARVIAKETRNAILDCMQERLTPDNFDELSVRLGFSPGRLFSSNATNFQKAIALVDTIEKQRRYPELIAQMLKINPYMV